jgi:hypothetical protein
MIAHGHHMHTTTIAPRCRCAAAQLTSLRSLSVAGCLTESMEEYQSRPVSYYLPATKYSHNIWRNDRWCRMADVWRTVAAHTPLRELRLTHLRVSTVDSWRTPPANDHLRLVPAHVTSIRGIHPALDWSLPPFSLTSLELSGVTFTYQHLRQQVGHASRMLFCCVPCTFPQGCFCDPARM